MTYFDFVVASSLASECPTTRQVDNSLIVAAINTETVAEFTSATVSDVGVDTSICGDLTY